MATNEDLLTFLGNLKDLDAGGCPAPFIGEVLYPCTGGCKSHTIHPTMKIGVPRGENLWCDDSQREKKPKLTKS